MERIEHEERFSICGRLRSGVAAETQNSEGLVSGVVSTVAAATGFEEVLFVIESRTTRVKRTLGEFQNLLAELQFRFPKTAMPLLPSRRWRNQIQSITETVGGIGGSLGVAVVTAGAAAGAAGVAVLTSALPCPRY